TRPAGVERAERRAGAPDGVVRGVADDPVVLPGGSWGSPCGQGPPVVHHEGHTDVRRYARAAAVADVGVRDLWGVWCRNALAGMHQTPALQAGGGSLKARNASLRPEPSALAGCLAPDPWPRPRA